MASTLGVAVAARVAVAALHVARAVRSAAVRVAIITFLSVSVHAAVRVAVNSSATAISGADSTAVSTAVHIAIADFFAWIHRTAGCLICLFPAHDYLPLNE